MGLPVLSARLASCLFVIVGHDRMAFSDVVHLYYSASPIASTDRRFRHGTRPSWPDLPYNYYSVFEAPREAVDFYNTRSIRSDWRAPEVVESVNSENPEKKVGSCGALRNK